MKDVIMINTNPIAVPSIVLPLLILGIILFLPNILPPKYAKISIVLTKITIYKITYKPLGLCRIPINEKKEKIIRFDKINFIKLVLLKIKKNKLIKKEKIRKKIKLLIIIGKIS